MRSWPVGNLHRCRLAVCWIASRRPPRADGWRAGPRALTCACQRSASVSCRADFASRTVPETNREAYISAQQPTPSPQAWFPGPHEHPRRACSAEVPPRQGPGSSVRLIARIREREAFVRLRRNGSRLRIEPLWCSYVPDPHVMPPQVAFAIGRPVGSAVRRNRVRRRMRAILSDSEVPPGLLLIGASPPVGELTYDELRKKVHQLVCLLSAPSTRTKQP